MSHIFDALERAEAERSGIELDAFEMPTELLQIVQICFRRSESQLKKMATLWKTRGLSLTQTIRAAFPLTEHPAEPIPQAPPQPQASSAIPA